MADSLESESAAALLSMKDGGRSIQATMSPSRRGNPPRIRKRNRLIFNDDEDTSYTLSRSSPRKNIRVASPSAAVVVPPAPDKRVAQKVGLRLRNLLKLPKAHKWVCYEWFYSNIDQPLFLGDNDFCVCFRETFAPLKTRKLTRVEWCKIRRLMGKPRRCSPAFFAEERAALDTKRMKLRQLQQRKVVDLAHFQDLPEEIPLLLVIGTKATARLRKPQDGLFLGSIDAVDTSNSTYRITFDRPGLGTFSIPDYEVLSNEAPEVMPISSFAQKHRPRNMFFTPPRFVPGSPWPQLAFLPTVLSQINKLTLEFLEQITSQQNREPLLPLLPWTLHHCIQESIPPFHNRTENPTNDNDPLLGGSPLKPELSFIDEGTLGGFPKKFLVLLVRLSKILAVKKEKLDQLKEMNTQAEKMTSYQEVIPLDFQKRYAAIILEFEKLNKDLNEYLVGVQQYCQEIAPEQGLQPVIQPDALRQRCLNQAQEMIKMSNGAHGLPQVRNEKMLDLIAHLTSLMLQVKNLAANDFNSFEFKSLSDSLGEIRSKLEPQNISVFRNQVEIHINHIQGGLSQMGNLHAFSTQNIPV